MVSVALLGVQQPRTHHAPASAFSRNNPLDRQRLIIGPLKNWRLNLFQFANTRNLLFVAHGANILIYEPSFPTQRLADIPSLVIDAPPSTQGLRGYIDPRDSHSINNLLVHPFGSEEVVVAARDDGDVDAYLVQHIYRAVLAARHDKSGSLRASPSTPPHAELRPILHRNVGSSAWGLAVHANARMIAVSSNNHEINIFAFALVAGADAHGIPHDRDSDEHIRLPNGHANIPCITFCNTGHDHDGSWLLTVDISGLTRAWHIPTMRTGQGASVACQRRISSDFSPEAAGWLVSFINPRTFLERGDLAASAGDCSVPVWDQPARADGPCGSSASGLGHSQQPTPDYTSTPQGSRRESRGRSASWDSSSTVPSPLLSPTDLGQQLTHVEVTVAGRQEHTFSWRRTRPSTVPASDLAVSGTDEDGDGDEADCSLEVILSAGPPAPNTHHRILAQIMRDLQQATDDDDENDMDDADSALNSYDPTQSVYVEYLSPQPLCPTIPCPILYGSVHDFFLLQPTRNSARTHDLTDNFPIMAHRQAFSRPSIDLSDEHWDLAETTETHARCSLSAQIPALGVVVLGTQAGRVGVYTCVKARRRINFPVQRDVRVDTEKWVYGLERVALLPSLEHEQDRVRPMAQLVGLAVAPMQGSEELAADLQRWRLLVAYQDWTVLSYEICRDDGGVVVDNVML